ncbi:MAG: bifunctional tetrahydrofolate synthase/dihydrofolate synthase [Woeseiaceae bacterium]|nr:bifunctional tetrahydrofolate synthase/dihydrofolate synthase [Woeseiaceae bacterium]
MTRNGLADWLARLEKFSPDEIVLGLERVHEVLDRLDITYPRHVFHVAGTNGKGSSVALTQALLQSAGQRVGAYTSPHILHYNERINVDGEPATDAEIIAAFERVEAVRGDVPLTYFEYGTIAAMLVFEKARVDTAVLEIGMGGRLDAVNAIEPDAGLITSIGLDHCEWLGDTLEDIGREKAGIMRRGKPIVFASEEVPASVVEHADEISADLRLAGRDYRWSSAKDGWEWRGRSTTLADLEFPALRAPIQLQNAAGVLALIEAAGFGDILDRDRVNATLASVSIPGRMQTVKTDREWLLDVAHNPAAAAALARALQAMPPRGRTVAILGMLDDKDVEGLVTALGDVVDKWIAVTANSPRAIPVDELARRVANRANQGCLEAGSMTAALEEARRFTSSDDRIVVTGSFFVVGPALEALGLYSPR